jgi:hypothetical protein
MKRRRQLAVVLQLRVPLTLSNLSTLPVYADSLHYTAPNKAKTMKVTLSGIQRHAN